MRKAIPFLILILLLGCENRDINEGEQFRPREVHDSFNAVTFSTVNVDGIEYLMLERDNNNPHEGFGFMAFRANRMIEKQDSLLAHMKTIGEMQSKMYARLFGVNEEEGTALYEQLFNVYLQAQQEELTTLEETTGKAEE